MHDTKFQAEQETMKTCGEIIERAQAEPGKSYAGIAEPCTYSELMYSLYDGGENRFLTLYWAWGGFRVIRTGFMIIAPFKENPSGLKERNLFRMCYTLLMTAQLYFTDKMKSRIWWMF